MKRRVGVGVGGKGRTELGVSLTPLIVSLSLSLSLFHVYEGNDRYNGCMEIPKGKSTMGFYSWI